MDKSSTGNGKDRGNGGSPKNPGADAFPLPKLGRNTPACAYPHPLFVSRGSPWEG